LAAGIGSVVKDASSDLSPRVRRRGQTGLSVNDSLTKRAHRAHTLNRTVADAMSYSLSQAAEACRVNRTTISRAIKQGKLSATKDAHDYWQVEPAELHRVYPPAEARTKGARNGSHYRAHVAEAALNMQVTVLKETADLLRDQLDDVRKDRDLWRDQAAAVTRQLADQSAKAVQPAARPWWKRLAG
jgi:hypothetical protein